MKRTPTKAYKGMAMEGFIASWYARTTRNQEDFKTLPARLHAQLAPGSRILEVAPGPGYLSIALAKLGFNVVGLDISKSFVEIARANARQANVTAEFRLGNASEMAFANSSFDFIVCRAAFKNFAEPVRALQEMARILAPGGTALIIDLRRDAPPEAIEREIQTMRLNPFNSFITRWTFDNMLLKSAYTTTQIRDMVAQTSFRACDIRTDNIGMEIRLAK